MNWPIIFPAVIIGLVLLGLAILWYQPEARHAPFKAGQVWKNSAGFTMKILQVNKLPLRIAEDILDDDGRKTLDIIRKTPEGMVENIFGYSAADFRRLIIKNRYRIV